MLLVTSTAISGSSSSGRHLGATFLTSQLFHFILTTQGSIPSSQDARLTLLNLPYSDLLYSTKSSRNHFETHDFMWPKIS